MEKNGPFYFKPLVNHSYFLQATFPTCVVLQQPVLNHVETIAAVHNVRGHDHGVVLLRVQRLIHGHSAVGAEQGQGYHALVLWFGDVVLHLDACQKMTPVRECWAASRVFASVRSADVQTRFAATLNKIKQEMLHDCEGFYVDSSKRPEQEQ